MKKQFVLLVALLALIASCSKKSTPAAEKKTSVAVLFSKNCEGCHGADGKSGMAPNLSKTDLDLQGITKIITQGHEHMPAFGDELSSTQIEALAKWILSIKS